MLTDWRLFYEYEVARILHRTAELVRARSGDPRAGSSTSVAELAEPAAASPELS